MIRRRAGGCALAIGIVAALAAGAGHISAARTTESADFTILLETIGRAPGPVAVGGGYLVWATQGGQKPLPNTLFQQRIGGRRAARLANTAAAPYGVASTAGWVVYARDAAPEMHLLAITHDRSRTILLTRRLIAPIDARGERVAWAEQDGSTQRVVVRDMASGHEQVVARMPRCTKGRCYRIDTVALADDGVVFDRGAIGAQPSLIVRRGFRDRVTQVVSVADDPQPMLARSDSGAFYHAFGRGWFRWGFQALRPRFTGLGPLAPAILEDKHGRLLSVSRKGCRTNLDIQQGSRRVAVAAPVRAPSSPRDLGGLCRDLTGFAWTDGSLVTAWAIEPQVSSETHTDIGLTGLIVSSAG